MEADVVPEEGVYEKIRNARTKIQTMPKLYPSQGAYARKRITATGPVKSDNLTHGKAHSILPAKPKVRPNIKMIKLQNHEYW